MRLKEICEKVRQTQAPLGIEGSCKEVSLAISYEAMMSDIDVCICIGTYKGEDHFWIRNNNTIYDATASQFGAKEDVVIVEENDATDYEEKDFIYVSSALVRKLTSH